MNAEHRRKPSEGFLILGMHPKVLLTTGIAALGSLTVAATLIISAVHSATQQVRVIRDELLQRPPTTQDDLDRVQRQIADTTRGIRQQVRDQIAQIDQVDQPAPVVVRAPEERPVKAPRERRTPPVAPAKPPPTPTPAPRVLPPLPPLLP